MNRNKTYLERKLSIKCKIEHLEPFQKNINLIFKVIKKGYSRRIRKNGSFVSECLIGDDTGTILLTVWDEDIEMLEVGEYFSISDAFTNIHRDHLKLNKKRYEEIEPYPDQEYDINLENNISKEVYEQTLTLLKTKDPSADMIAKGINIGQDNVKIVGMNI